MKEFQSNDLCERFGTCIVRKVTEDTYFIYNNFKALILHIICIRLNALGELYFCI
jgi:hypothetical protein